MQARGDWVVRRGRGGGGGGEGRGVCIKKGHALFVLIERTLTEWIYEMLLGTADK